MKGWGFVTFVLLYVVPLSVLLGGGVVVAVRKWEAYCDEHRERINKGLDGGGHV